MTDTTVPDGLRVAAVRGVLWTALQKWFSRFAQLITLVVLARELDSTAFGLVALASVFVSMVSALADLGLTTYLVQASTVQQRTTSTAFWTTMAAGGVLCGILQIAAPWIADWFGEPALTPLIRVSAFALVLIAASAVPVALLTREMRMKPLALRQVAGTTVGSIGSVVLALAGAGAWALVFQTLAPLVVGGVFLWAAVRWRPTLTYDGAEARALIRFGLPVMGTTLVHQFRDRGDELVIGAVLGVELLGFWVVSLRLMRTVIDLFTSIVSTMALTTFAKVADDRARLMRAFRQAVTAGAGLLSPVMVGLAIISPVLVPFVFGPTWEMSGRISQIVSLAGLVIAVQWLDGPLWWAMRRPNVEFALTVVISVLHLGIVLLAAPHGLIALAWALLARYALIVPIRVLALRRVGGISLTVYADLPRILAAVALMAAALVAVDRTVLTSLPPAWRLTADVALAGVAWVIGMRLFSRAIAARLWSDLRSVVRR